MANIYLTMKSGEIKQFIHEGRSGGSYTKELTLKDGWAIIEDEWGKKYIFPSADIEKIEERPHNYRY